MPGENPNDVGEYEDGEDEGKGDGRVRTTAPLFRKKWPSLRPSNSASRISSASCGAATEFCGSGATAICTSCTALFVHTRVSPERVRRILVVRTMTRLFRTPFIALVRTMCLRKTKKTLAGRTAGELAPSQGPYVEIVRPNET